jgi:hypothetical protein
MADEIRTQSYLEVSNGNFVQPRLGNFVQQIDQATPGGGVPGQITATTAGVDVSVTGLTAVGLVYIRNIDSTNFVTVGPKLAGTFYPFIKIKPGEAYIFRLDSAVVPSTTTFHVKADTANCKVHVAVMEN